MINSIIESMDNWKKLKNLYLKDHFDKEYLETPKRREDALIAIEKLIKVHFSHIISQPKFLKRYTKEEFEIELKLKKGTELSGAEKSVIHGFYKFLPEL